MSNLARHNSSSSLDMTAIVAPFGASRLHPPAKAVLNGRPARILYHVLFRCDIPRQCFDGRRGRQKKPIDRFRRQSLWRDGVLDTIRTNSSTNQGGHDGSASQSEAQIAADRPHVSPRSAVNLELDLRIGETHEIEPINVDLTGKQLDLLALASQVVGAVPVDMNGGKGRRGSAESARKMPAGRPRPGRV